MKISLFVQLVGLLTLTVEVPCFKEKTAVEPETLWKSVVVEQIVFHNGEELTVVDQHWRPMTHKELKETVEAARKAIESWPEWKRVAADDALWNRPTNTIPRKPVVLEDHY